MKTLEALKCINDGKRMRKIRWREGYYVYKNNEGNLTTWNGSLYHLGINFNDEWEEYDNRFPIAKEWKDLYKAVKSINGIFECDSDCGNCILGDVEVSCQNLNMEAFIEELENLNKIYKLDK